MSTKTITIREALREAIFEEMERDPTVFLFGEEVGEYNGAYKISEGLLDQFGPRRVIDTPISESGFTGLAVGAAMVGLRPIVEFMSFNFSLVAMDQIVSNASKMHYMSGGMFNVPMVMRGCNGSAAQVSSQHSHCMESIFSYIPGLHVISPSSAKDHKGLLKSAIRDDNPVIFLENELLYSLPGEVPSDEFTIPIGVAEIKKEGTDVTVIAHSRMVEFVKVALPALSEMGIDIELLDPRTLKPLDIETIVRSVKKTNRVVIVEEGWRFCGIGSEIADQIYSACFDYLDSPVVRVTSTENPMPYAKNLEVATLPSPEKIIEAIKSVTYRN
ncbi:MAG: pyruvate dehydrogenase complex E1 component subunit beta [SAR324 cluster bacterium]|nr:pyruvate dehydrogenase complex E1 component subunit beta [SAR324 cluster bacterium]